MEKLYSSLIFSSAKRLFTSFQSLFLFGFLFVSLCMQAQQVPDNCNFLNKIAGIASVNGAEISTYDPVSKRVYTVAGPIIEYYGLSNTGALTLKGELPLGFTLPSGTNAVPNSVAYKNGIVAASYAVINATTNAQQPGRVTFYEATTGKILKSV